MNPNAKNPLLADAAADNAPRLVGRAAWLRPARSAAGWWLRVAALAVAYCAAGLAGLQLALPPGYASAVWPPSGIMLAFLLLWGSRVWPGVWLGSFVLNAWVGGVSSDPAALDAWWIAAAISTGSTIQGIVGRGLVLRFVDAQLRLERGLDVVRFILLGGPLACVIAASVGSAALLLGHRLPMAELGVNWLTWWVGDSMGVFLVAPILLVWASEPAPTRMKRLRPVGVTVLLSLLIGALVVHNSNREENERIDRQFRQIAEQLDGRLDEALARLTGTVANLVSYYEASEHVDEREFRQLADGLLSRAPGVVALEWVRRVEAPALTAYGREDGGAAGDPVFEFDADGRRRAVGVRPVYYPVRHVWPPFDDRGVVGYDLGSDPLRAALLHVAERDRGIRYSGALSLIHTGAAGVLVVEPVGGSGPPLGFATAVVGMRELMDYVLDGIDVRDLSVALVGVDAHTVEQVLFASGDPHAEPKLSWQDAHTLGERQWQLRVTAGDAFLLANRSQQSWLTQLLVLAFSALLGGFLLVITGRAARIEQVVSERTLELECKNAALSREIAERHHGEVALARSEARFRGVFESVGTAIAFADSEGRITGANAAFQQMLGYADGELIGMNFSQLTHPDDLPREVQLYVEVASGRRHEYRIEKRYVHRNGRVFWVDLAVSVVRDADGKPEYFVGIVQDIDERKRAEARLRLSAEVFEHLGEAIMITDADNRIVSVNRAFSAITGYSLDEVLGRNPSVLASGRHDKDFYRQMWRTLQLEGVWKGEVWDRRKSGELYPEWLTISLVRDAAGRVVHHVAVFSDISERKASEERIRYLAEVDALTNLPNRIVLADRLTLALSSSQRSGRPFAVMFIDIDRFKNINDSLGHSIGDALLREMASRLHAVVRVTDTVARQGGDEFVILVTHVVDAEHLAHMASKILDAVSKPFVIEQHVLSTTASIGIAMYPDDGVDVDTLLKNADAAMYVAKNSGRASFRFFTKDMNARVHEFLRIETDLRKALETDELRLYYQPQIDVASGEVVGVEALVRWQHPERGLVMPDQFIPVAEESGLISQISDWVLREACRQNREWQRRGLKAVPVSVNLSALELHRDDTVERITRVLDEHGLHPRWLELEVTESMLMQDVESVTETLRRLRELGVLIALDDFGTGYSSLAYLQRFPLSTLKVDRSFVRDILDDSDDAAICRAVIALGRSLGLRIVAEGVESEAQLSFLRRNGCDRAQGALFSWGVPPEDVEPFLQPGRARVHAPVETVF
ncbi:MAG: EAL domain-containing protein [Nevskiales bacterium]|nr:EAL domain-containing protein [Nevskiales bacterium]